jgi:hypothetical protein
MTITESCENAQSEATQMRSGWWLLPSLLCGAAIWGKVIVTLVG